MGVLSGVSIRLRTTHSFLQNSSGSKGKTIPYSWETVQAPSQVQARNGRCPSTKITYRGSCKSWFLAYMIFPSRFCWLPELQSERHILFSVYLPRVYVIEIWF